MYQKNPLIQEGIVDTVKKVLGKKKPMTPKQIVNASVKKSLVKGGFDRRYQSMYRDPFSISM